MKKIKIIAWAAVLSALLFAGSAWAKWETVGIIGPGSPGIGELTLSGEDFSRAQKGMLVVNGKSVVLYDRVEGVLGIKVFIVIGEDDVLEWKIWIDDEEDI